MVIQSHPPQFVYQCEVLLLQLVVYCPFDALKSTWDHLLQ